MNPKQRKKLELQIEETRKELLGVFEEYRRQEWGEFENEVSFLGRIAGRVAILASALLHLQGTDLPSSFFLGEVAGHLLAAEVSTVENEIAKAMEQAMNN